MKLKFTISLSLVFVSTGVAGVFAAPSFATPQQGAATVSINPKDFGAVGDCQSHPLSSIYHSLAAAQAVYPSITSLSQQVDYAAIKAASSVAFGADGAEHGYTNRALNKPLYLPGGCYNLGDDTWLVRNAVGIHISGASRMSTRVVSNKTAFGTDGLWYSQIEGIEFASLTKTATAAFDIDGNVPGHPYDTRGVQGNTFKDLLIEGGGSDYAFSLCRKGQSGGQCSENLYLDLHLNNASFAVYYQYGYNALNNTFIGGNFQNYPKHGIYLVAGSVNLFSVGFQSTRQYQQLANGGSDIDASQAGVNDKLLIYGCRTESLRFFNGAWSQTADIRGLNQTPSVAAWSAKANFGVDTVTIAATAAGNKLFRATTAGTTGAEPPIWPSTGTIKDGTITWTETEFNAVSLASGQLSVSTITVGNLQLANNQQQQQTVEVRTDYTASVLDDLLLVDASKANILITLPTAFLGKTYTVKKWDTTAHTVTIHYGGVGNGIELTGDVVIPGGSRGYVTLAKAGGGNLSGAFWIVGKSF
jgi:hypothetical protein